MYNGIFNNHEAGNLFKLPQSHGKDLKFVSCWLTLTNWPACHVCQSMMRNYREAAINSLRVNYQIVDVWKMCHSIRCSQMMCTYVYGHMNAIPFRIKLVWFTPKFRIFVQWLSWEQHIHSFLHGEVTHNTVLSAHTRRSESVRKNSY